MSTKQPKEILKIKIPTEKDLQTQINSAGKELGELHIKYNKLFENKLKDSPEYNTLLEDFIKEKEMLFRKNFSIGFIQNKLIKLVERKEDEVVFDTKLVAIQVKYYEMLMSYDYALFNGFYPTESPESINKAVRTLHEKYGLFTTEDIKDDNIHIFEGVFKKVA